jgi:hypothetical protein
MISKEELIEEYNRRVDLYNKYQLSHITDEDFRLKQCANFKAQKNGFWEYRTECKLTLQEFISAIFSEVNQKSFTEIKKMVSEAGYKYPDRTIRNYVLEHAYAISKNDDMFIRNDDVNDKKPARQYGLKNIFINQVIVALKDVKCIQEDLIQIVIEKFKEMNRIIKPSIARQFLIKYSEPPYSFWFCQKDTQGQQVMILNHKRIEDVDLEKIGLKEEKAYIANIKSLIINYLKSSFENKEKRAVLKKIFEDQMPSDIKTNNFYKILKKIEEIEVVDRDYIKLKNSLELVEPHSNNIEHLTISDTSVLQRQRFVWSDLKKKLISELSQFPMDKNEIEIGLEEMYLRLNPNPELGVQRLLQYMYEFFFCKNDHFDRDTIFLWLIISYEPFLKLYRGYHSDTEGLFNIIESMPSIAEIQNYKFKKNKIDISELDKRQLTFSYFMNSLIFFRNLYTHDVNKAAIQLNTTKQMQYISDFIALYVFTSYVLKK